MYGPSKLSPGRLVKLTISALFYLATAPVEFLRRMLGLPPAGRCVVIYYHSVPAEHRARFAHQLDILRRHAPPIDVAAPVDLNPGEHFSGITFDDAFENFVDVALPELRKRNIPSLMFVISDALGRAFGPQGRAERVMSAEQMVAIPRGLVAFGSHTVTHPFMPDLDDAEARSELADSKCKLEALLDREVDTFSFPFGGFTQRQIEICREVGYKRVFTTEPYFAFLKGQEPFALGRVRVDPWDLNLEFFLKIKGAYRWLPLAIRVKRKFRSMLKAQTLEASPEEKRSMIQEWSKS